jgi:hypothetical protein
MQPWLNNRKMGGVMELFAKQPAGPKIDSILDNEGGSGDEEYELHPGLEAAADAIIIATHGHDSKKLARALKDAHTIIGSSDDT